jgi:hypothetical protein
MRIPPLGLCSVLKGNSFSNPRVRFGNSFLLENTQQCRCHINRQPVIFSREEFDAFVTGVCLGLDRQLVKTQTKHSEKLVFFPTDTNAGRSELNRRSARFWIAGGECLTVNGKIGRHFLTHSYELSTVWRRLHCNSPVKRFFWLDCKSRAERTLRP